MKLHGLKRQPAVQAGIKKQPAKLVQCLLYEQQVQRFTGVALTLPQRTRALHWRHEVSAARMVRPETACRCVGVTPHSTVTQYRRDGIAYRRVRDAAPVPVQLAWRSHDPHPATHAAVALLSELYRRR